MGSKIIGVAGGSGSGKTTFVEFIKNQIGTENCEVLYQDYYYHDQSKKFDRDGGRVNFDHPDSIEFSLLKQHMLHLKDGLGVEVPVYDFKTHRRHKEKRFIPAKPIILVDGILIFHSMEMINLFDFRIFIDTQEKERYRRRLHRDVKERGRTPEGVKEQFYKQVKPMHDQFVEPSKQHCHQIISGEDSFENISILDTEVLLELGI